MIRYLPILMVALGLLLVSTSFAHAQSSVRAPVDAAAVCRVTADSQAAADSPKLGRCWKQMGLGILVAGCKVHAQLPHDEFSVAQRPEPCWPPLTDPVLLDGPVPLLDIPPPRA